MVGILEAGGAVDDIGAITHLGVMDEAMPEFDADGFGIEAEGADIIGINAFAKDNISFDTDAAGFDADISVDIVESIEIDGDVAVDFLENGRLD